MENFHCLAYPSILLIYKHCSWIPLRLKTLGSTYTTMTALFLLLPSEHKHPDNHAVATTVSKYVVRHHSMGTPTHLRDRTDSMDTWTSSSQAVTSRMNAPQNILCKTDVMTIVIRVVMESNPYAATYRNIHAVQ